MALIVVPGIGSALLAPLQDEGSTAWARRFEGQGGFEPSLGFPGVPSLAVQTTQGLGFMAAGGIYGAGIVHAFEIETGRPRWSVETEGLPNALAVSADDSLLYVAQYDGHILALHVDSGAVAWYAGEGAGHFDAISVWDGGLTASGFRYDLGSGYVASFSDRGELLWESIGPSGWSTSSMVEDAGLTFVASDGHPGGIRVTKIEARDTRTGEAVWVRSWHGGDAFWQSRPIAGSSSVLVVGNATTSGERSFVMSLDRDDGTVRWRRSIAVGWVAALAVDARSDSLYVAGAGGIAGARVATLVALDLSTGDARWTATRRSSYEDGQSEASSLLVANEGARVCMGVATFGRVSPIGYDYLVTREVVVDCHEPLLGARVWERARTFDPWDIPDQGHSVALLGSGLAETILVAGLGGNRWTFSVEVDAFRTRTVVTLPPG